MPVFSSTVRTIPSPFFGKRNQQVYREQHLIAGFFGNRLRLLQGLLGLLGEFV